MVTSIQTGNKLLRLVQLTICFLEVAYRENPKTNSNSSLFYNFDWILHPRRRQSSH